MAHDDHGRHELPFWQKYIFSTDHTIPSSASLESFRRIIGVVKDIGRYT